MRSVRRDASLVLLVAVPYDGERLVLVDVGDIFSVASTAIFPASLLSASAHAPARAAITDPTW